jgi:hypothetical protein
VDPSANLDALEKRIFFILPGLELRSLDRPADHYSDFSIPASIKITIG